jgi:hypothetical protein
VAQRDRDLIALRDLLLSSQLAFDYGDEDMLARLGAVKRCASRATLTVGEAAYRAVIVPAVGTIRSTTIALLERFAAEGGIVVRAAGGKSAFVDGEESDALERFASATPAVKQDRGSLTASLATACRRVTITDGAGSPVRCCLYRLRRDGDGFALFVCNTGHDFDSPFDEWAVGEVYVDERRLALPRASIAVRATTGEQPLELDPATGHVFVADAVREGDSWVVSTSFPALGSRLLLFPHGESPGATFGPRPVYESARTFELAGPWNAELTEPNVLVLTAPHGARAPKPRTRRRIYSARTTRCVRPWGCRFAAPPWSSHGRA